MRSSSARNELLASALPSPAARPARSRAVKAILRCAASLGVAGLLVGCETKGFLDPKEVGAYNREALVVPILKTIDPSIDENDAQFVNATPPTAEDRATSHEEYRVSRNDLLSVNISDLVQPGQQQIETRRVTEGGLISLPFIGPLRADGLTEIELEQAIAQAYKEAQLINNATVSVTVVEARGRSFEVTGSVNRPNIYAIPEADFRLMDALVVAGDVVTPQIEYIYVIRRLDIEPPASRPRRPGNTGPATMPSSAPSPDDLAPRGQLIQPSDSATAGQATANHVLNLLADTPAAEDAPALANTGLTPAASSLPRTPAPDTAHVLLAQASSGGGFQFNAPALPANVRVIRIPYQAIHNGDLNYNIAIRPHDVIRVQPMPVGFYYVYGHVARPGVFTLAGQKVTIKQAIGGAGMFDELAIPQRAQIVRRIRPDHEVSVRIDLAKIFNMEQPDLYLKPDDQIMVGTNAIAPFLAALRGGFRMTYGFGFLFDRNFAYSNINGGV